MEVRGRQTSSLSPLYVRGCLQVAISWERGGYIAPSQSVSSKGWGRLSRTSTGALNKSTAQRSPQRTQRNTKNWPLRGVTNLALFYFWQVLSSMLGYLIIWKLTWCHQRRNFDYLALGSASEDCSSNGLSGLSPAVESFPTWLPCDLQVRKCVE